MLVSNYIAIILIRYTAWYTDLVACIASTVYRAVPIYTILFFSTAITIEHALSFPTDDHNECLYSVILQ